MRIEASGAGVLDNFKETTDLCDEKIRTVAGFLDLLDRRLGGRLIPAIFSERRLRDDICILLNGRSIRTFPDRMDTRLKDGDRLFICVVIAGG